MASGHGTHAGGPSPREGGDGHAGMGAHGMEMVSSVTLAQLLSVTLLTLLALTAAVLWSAANYNLSISAEEVDGAIMPPGMVNRRDVPAEAMRDMAAVDPGDVDCTAPAPARGDQSLQPTITGGEKVYDLTVPVIKWNILPDEQVMAYVINRQVPGPRIRVTQGDRVAST